jgi:hypothetical protein
MMRLAPRLDNELAVVHDLDIARRFLIRDGQAFQHYEMRDSPEYVWFQWCDYAGDLPVRNVVSVVRLHRRSSGEKGG